MKVLKKNKTEIKQATDKGLGKGWTIKSGEGDKIKFYPFFAENEEGDVECIGTKLKIPTDNGSKTISLHFENLYQYVYAISNEEHRTRLENMKTRQVRKIPYDVTIKIREDERKAMLIKRRIELPVDELIAAYCQHEAVKFNIAKQKRSAGKFV